MGDVMGTRGMQAFVPAELWPETQPMVEAMLTRTLERDGCVNIHVERPERVDKRLTAAGTRVPAGWSICAYGERLRHD